MVPAKRVAVVLAVLAVAVPATVGAGIFAHCGICGLNFGFGLGCGCGPCGMCHMPRPACVCPAPVLPAPVSMVPVTQTHFRQEQFVTYRDVPRTEIRREAFVEQVPVTVMVSQTRFRDVAYQVTQRVAETHSRMVPVQTVNYAPGCSAPVSAACSGPAVIGTAFAPSPAAYAETIPYAVPTAVTPLTPSAGIPTLPPITVSPYGTSPVVPAYPDGPATDSWETIRPRTPSHPTSGNSLFRPAPSAATVWQSSF
jgi:hypothetical protein